MKFEYKTSSNNDSQIFSHFDILREKENEILELKKHLQVANTSKDFQLKDQETKLSELKVK